MDKKQKLQLPFTAEERDVIPYQIDPYLDSLLEDYSNLLREHLHFGSKLLKWDVKKNSTIENGSLPSLYFRNILDIIDGVSVLIRNSSIDPAIVLVRSLIETILNLFYLIEKDEPNRINQFLLWKIKNDIKTHKKFVSGERVSKEFIGKLEKTYTNVNFQKYLDGKEVKKNLEHKSSLLRSDKFKDINIEYERTKRKLKNPPWYSLYNGPRNMEALSSHFGMIYEYELLYRKYSRNVHSNHITKGLAFDPNDKGFAQVIQIRDFEECKNLVSASVNLILKCYNRFVDSRIPKYREQKKEWYLKIQETQKIILSRELHYKK